MYSMRKGLKINFRLDEQDDLLFQHGFAVQRRAEPTLEMAEWVRRACRELATRDLAAFSGASKNSAVAK